MINFQLLEITFILQILNVIFGSLLRIEVLSKQIDKVSQAIKTMRKLAKLLCMSTTLKHYSGHNCVSTAIHSR